MEIQQLIENTSTFNRADLRFIIWQSSAGIMHYLRRLIGLAYGLFLVGFVVWLAAKHSSFAYWTNSFLTIFGFTMGPWFIIRSVFTRQIVLRKAIKNKELQAPRHYQIDEDSISVQTPVSGAEVTNRFSVSSLECFWETTDTVYVRLKLEKKLFISYVFTMTAIHKATVMNY